MDDMADSLRELNEQYVRQAKWFYGIRSRLLRKAGIASKQHVLELGCGTGAVTPELTRRCAGDVVSVDINSELFSEYPESFQGARTVVAAGERLPFEKDSFDLAFTQMLFLWVHDPKRVLKEASRVLEEGCELIIAAEPDYSGCIAHPRETDPGPAICEALRRLGADPCVARAIPEALLAAGFEFEMGVHPSLFQPEELRKEWPKEVAFIESIGGEPPDRNRPPAFLFMPFFWFFARKR